MICLRSGTLTSLNLRLPGLLAQQLRIQDLEQQFLLAVNLPPSLFLFSSHSFIEFLASILEVYLLKFELSLITL